VACPPSLKTKNLLSSIRRAFLKTSTQRGASNSITHYPRLETFLVVHYSSPFAELFLIKETQSSIDPEGAIFKII
jgi:hypothetical protein